MSESARLTFGDIARWRGGWGLGGGENKRELKHPDFKRDVKGQSNVVVLDRDAPTLNPKLYLVSNLLSIFVGSLFL